MRTRHRRKRLLSDINVVPYIDVMLVLLIIFMVTAPLITQGVKVDLPQVASEPVPPSDSQPLIVSVDAEGRYYLDYGEDRHAPIDGDTLAHRVAALLTHRPGIQVLVKGDRAAAYASVVELMALLQEAGVQGLGLLTVPPES
ncbi:MAG: protein TolR [Gammaproteobacteria bacterium]